MVVPLLDEEGGKEKAKMMEMGLTEANFDTKEEEDNELLDDKPKDDVEEKPKRLNLLLSVLAVSFGCFVHGTSIAYPQYAVEGLRVDSATFVGNTTETVLGFKYDDVQDNAWIISISAFGMIFGSLLAGPLNDIVGRKITCIVGVGVVFGISYILPLLAINMGMIYLARFLMGFGLGVSQFVSTLYIAEVSTPEQRGSMAVIPAMTGCLGANFCQVLGKFLDWKQLTVMFSVLNIPFVILILLIPESPAYLVSKDKLEEAHKVLRKLRGPSWNVTKEVNDIQKIYIGSGGKSGFPPLNVWIQPTVIKPLVIAFSLMCFFQMTGINLILQYAIQIFQEVSSIDAFEANIMLGSALFASNTITLFLAGRFPRRIMLLASSLGVSVTLAIMGFCFQVNGWEKDCVNQMKNESQALNMTDIEMTDECSYNLGWLSVVDAMVYMFVFNFGYGSLVWMTVVEILPASIRSFTNGITVGWVGMISFLSTYSYPFLMKDPNLEGKGVYWFYSAFSFLGFIFIAIFLPETRGKSEDELKKYFENSAVKVKKIEESPIIKQLKK